MNSKPESDNLPRLVRALGRAGLLPFVLLPALIALWPQYAELGRVALSSYSLAIICFLVGSWWGLSLIRRSPGALLMSNAVVILAVAGQVLLPSGPFLLFAALLLALTVLVERWHALFTPQPRYYLRMRLQLTVVAAVALSATTLLG